MASAARSPPIRLALMLAGAHRLDKIFLTPFSDASFFIRGKIAAKLTPQGPAQEVSMVLVRAMALRSCKSGGVQAGIRRFLRMTGKQLLVIQNRAAARPIDLRRMTITTTGNRHQILAALDGRLRLDLLFFAAGNCQQKGEPNNTLESNLHPPPPSSRLRNHIDHCRFAAIDNRDRFIERGPNSAGSVIGPKAST